MEELLVRVISTLLLLHSLDSKYCLVSFNRYGQLSGMVEPLAGLFGTAAVVVGCGGLIRTLIQ